MDYNSVLGLKDVKISNMEETADGLKVLMVLSQIFWKNMLKTQCSGAIYRTVLYSILTACDKSHRYKTYCKYNMNLIYVNYHRLCLFIKSDVAVDFFYPCK